MLKRLSTALGLEVRRRNVKSSDSLRLARMMTALDIDTVVDVGANAGLYGRSIRSGGFTRRILSVEPLEDAHRLLSGRASSDPSWDVHRRCAVTPTGGDSILRVSADGVSSSLMELTAAGRGAAPWAAAVGAERVPGVSLDMLLDEACTGGARCWLKLDVQGLECDLLAAADLRRSGLVAIQAEASFVELYRGQQLFDGLLGLLHRHGFCVWAVLPGFSDMRSGRMLQADFVAVRGAGG
jgi:FkbM family methyltransferase